jgi:hypothetical protein
MLTAANQSGLISGNAGMPVLDMAPAGGAVTSTIDLRLADSFNQLLSGLLGGDSPDVAAEPGQAFPVFMEMVQGSPLPAVATLTTPAVQVDSGANSLLSTAPALAQTPAITAANEPGSADPMAPTNLLAQDPGQAPLDIRELLTRLRVEPGNPVVRDLAIPTPGQPLSVHDRTPPAPVVHNLVDDQMMATMRDLTTNLCAVSTPVLSTVAGHSRLALQDREITLLPERGTLAFASERQPVQATTTLASTIDVPVDSSEWKQVLSERVVWLAGQKHTSAEIHLNPSKLGPIQVHISLDQNQAAVEFLSQHQAVRHVLADSIPLLREMLNQGGIQLLNVNVGDSTGQGQPDPRTGQDPAGLPPYKISASDPDGMNEQTTSIRRIGLVDYYA